MKKIKLFFVRVLAVIVRNLFPVTAVERFSFLSNENAKYFAPKTEKTLSIVSFNSDEYLQVRYWTTDVITRLLRQKRYSLIKRITTLEQFKIIAANGSISDIANALRYYTPKMEVLEDILRYKTIDDLINLYKETQDKNIYNAYSLWNILSVPAGDITERVSASDQSWKLVFLIADHFPKRSVEFLEILSEIPEGRVASYLPIIEKLSLIAVKHNKNISAVMRLIEYSNQAYSIFKKTYGGENLAFAVRKCFSMKILNLKSTDNTEKEDAEFWLAAGYRNLEYSGVQVTIINGLKFLKTLLDQSRFSRLYHAIIVVMKNNRENSYYAVSVMLEFATKQEDIDYLRRELVEVSKPEMLIKDFPFLDWGAETVKLAMAKLVCAQKFPISRINELSDELKAYVREKMETEAEKAGLLLDPASIVEHKLTVEAERYLLTSTNDFYHKYQISYIDKFGIRAQNFIVLLNLTDRTLLARYVDKYGLTDLQYMLLCQSRFKAQAPLWREKVGIKM